MPVRIDRDRRDEILAAAYKKNAWYCERLGHQYVPDFGLNGEYACGYCRAARALTAPQPNDKIREAV